MRVVVVGPGAVGCFIAGKMTSAAEVWLLDHRPERAARIMANHGIVCDGSDGRWQAACPVTCQAAEVGQADVVVVCVKAHDVPTALRGVRGAVGPETRVVMLHNGLVPSDRIASACGRGVMIPAVAYLGVRLISDGVIEQTGRGRIMLGGDGSGRETVRRLMRSAGLDARRSGDIRREVWAKLAVNAGINAVSALTGLTNGELLERPETRQMMDRAVAETVAVARRRGILLSVRSMQTRLRIVARDTAGNVSSMLQDVRAHRRTEIDAINGAVVEHGRACRVATPVNETLWALVKTVEQDSGVRK